MGNIIFCPDGEIANSNVVVFLHVFLKQKSLLLVWSSLEVQLDAGLNSNV